MQLLVDRGAKLNVRDINGDTPLLICSASGFSEGVRLLLQVTDRLCRHVFFLFLLLCSAGCCCWSLLYSAVLCSQADSLRSHVSLREWLAFYSMFLNVRKVVCLQRWHGWCHVKLLPSHCFLCTPCNHAPWLCCRCSRWMMQTSKVNYLHETLYSNLDKCKELVSVTPEDSPQITVQCMTTV